MHSLPTPGACMIGSPAACRSTSTAARGTKPQPACAGSARSALLCCIHRRPAQRNFYTHVRDWVPLSGLFSQWPVPRLTPPHCQERFAVVQDLFEPNEGVHKKHFQGRGVAGQAVCHPKGRAADDKKNRGDGDDKKEEGDGPRGRVTKRQDLPQRCAPTSSEALRLLCLAPRSSEA